jgi:hypothetical protein
MPAQLGSGRIIPGVAAAVLLAAVLVCCTHSAVAQAQTSATIAAALSPNRLNAKGALTLTIDYAGEESGVPSPVRRASIELPAGLGLDVPSLRSCSPARLRARGPGGCPMQSKIGGGHAFVEGSAGSQTITERIGLSLFIGPLQSFQPSFEVLGQGYTPLQKRIVLGGTVTPSHAPYGEELVMSIPPIPTLPLEPDASIAKLVLTVGTSADRLAHDANTVVVPGRCPAGGFPFAAEFTYADGTTGSATATAPCPR